MCWQKQLLFFLVRVVKIHWQMAQTIYLYEVVDETIIIASTVKVERFSLSNFCPYYSLSRT